MLLSRENAFFSKILLLSFLKSVGRLGSKVKKMCYKECDSMPVNISLENKTDMFIGYYGGTYTMREYKVELRTPILMQIPYSEFCKLEKMIKVSFIKKQGGYMDLVVTVYKNENE